MGRFSVVLDPAGYYRPSEPGFDWIQNGNQLIQKSKLTPEFTVGGLNPTLYSPEGSEWMVCRPYQMDPSWPSAGLATNCILRKSLWTFGSGITAFEYQPSRQPDGTSSSGWEWIGIARTPSSLASLDGTSYSAIATAAGVTLPSGFATIATCSSNLDGQDITQQDYHPIIWWGAYPPPREPLIFGFGQLAFILYAESVCVLINRSMDRTTWETLGTYRLTGNATPAYGPSELTPGAGSVLATGAGRVKFNGLMVMPIGFDHIYLLPTGAKPIGIRIRDSGQTPSPSRLFSTGAWWIAAAPSQTVTFHAEIVAYQSGTLRAPADPLINLGQGYAPTVSPTVAASALIYSMSAGDVSYVYSGTFTTATSASSGQAISYGLNDSAGNPWVSNGARYSGNPSVTITPGNPGTNRGFLSPMLRMWEIRFPIVLSARARSQEILDGTKVRSWRASASRTSPDGRRIVIELNALGSEAVRISGHDIRDSYPVEIWEDTDDNGSLDTMRVAGWVESVDMAEIASEQASGRSTPVRNLVITAKGLLSRGAAPGGEWVMIPQVLNPSGAGFIEHSYAVAVALAAMGFDTTDTSKVGFQTDPLTGTSIARLPGTWGRSLSAEGVQNDSPWAPSEGEGKLEYAERIATTWRGWRLHEGLNGFIYYRSDYAVDVLVDGSTYTIAATIYRSRAEATAAGVTGQYVLAEDVSRAIETPIANAIRVKGEDADAKQTATLIDRDVLSLTTTSYRNFLGELRMLTIYEKMGIDRASRAQIARAMLRRTKIRHVSRTITVPLAPWQIGSGIIVGSFITIQNRGNYLVNEIELECIKSATGSGSVLRTKITGELVN